MQRLVSAMLVGWLTLACGMAAYASDAEPDPCAPAGRQIDPDYDEETRIEWPRESLRLKASPVPASRLETRLRLGLDGGRTAVLEDCPYGEDGRRFLFERYDQAGPFFVVRTFVGTTSSYRLVMRADGHGFDVAGAPIWTLEKTRFLTIGCSLEPSRGSLLIQAPADNRLVTEAEVALPCEQESCSARFDHQSWISVACVPREETSKRGSEFVLIRDPAGRWNRFGR